MISDAGYLVGDGSWTLRVYVTDLQVERTLRVKGDLHIGGVMLKLVEDLDIAMDWSDHALWWPMRNRWLTHTRQTLDQCGVQADALLNFTPMHKLLRLQLPDLRYLDMRVDFSIKTFGAVVQLCRKLDIRHPEELSLLKPLEANDLRHNYRDVATTKKQQQHHTNGNNHYYNNNNNNNNQQQPRTPPDTNTFIANHSPDGSNGSLDRFMCAPVSSSTPAAASASAASAVSSPKIDWKTNIDSNGSEWRSDVSNRTLACSPASASPEARNHLVRPRNLVEKARMNVAWLDSSLSIMEQGVHEFDTLCLRFKFSSFYDLNPRYDSVRINQIYEQAKWQLLNEEIDCTDEEMLMFAALQLQVNLQANQPQSNAEWIIDDDNNGSGADDDIDAALTDLQVTLEGTHLNSSTASGDITQVPELFDNLRFLKPKRFTLRAFKRYWFTCRDLNLMLFKTREETQPVHLINLRGCEVTPDVNLSQGKYGIKLEVASAEGMTEMWIRCDEEAQYARWMAACRLASKGRSLADSSYETEVRNIKSFLQMQHPAPAALNPPNTLDIQVEDYVAPKFVRKLKGGGGGGGNKLTVAQRILEAHGNVKDLPLIEAKLNYIKAWQSLPEYGIALFVVKFMGQKKEELLGVAHNRLMKMDINTGDHLKTWRYNTMKAWNVNWEVKHMMVQFEEQTNIIFSCLSADCKVIHEFIGGYIFLSMRSKEANQTLNEELFHKLTGGWL